MATVPIWDGSGDDQAWDALIIGGEFMPGIPTVEVTTKPVYDVKKPNGKALATMTDEGDEPAEVSVTLQLISQGDLDALPRALAVLQPPREGGKRDPAEILYPSVNVLGVESVVIGPITISPPTAQNGLLIKFTCTQWVPEPKKQKALGAAKLKQPVTLQDLDALKPSSEGVPINLIPDFIGFAP
jgi:hypothetical protein